MTLRTSARCCTGTFPARHQRGVSGVVLDARRMSTSTGAFGLAAHNRKKSSRKILPQHFLGSVAVAAVVLGCAWTVYTNVFGASIYPSMNSAAYDAPDRQAVERCRRPSRTAGLQRGVRVAAGAGPENFRSPRAFHLRLCLTKGLQPPPRRAKRRSLSTRRKIRAKRPPAGEAPKKSRSAKTC